VFDASPGFRRIRGGFYDVVMTRARLHAMTLSDDERRFGEVESEYRSDIQGDSAPKLN